MTSTTTKKRNKIKLWAVAAWLIVWQLVSMWIGQEILLVSPAAVFWRLLQLLPTGQFWSSVLFSVVRITGGFLLAAAAGTAAAGLAVRFGRVEEFLRPFVLAVRSVPVASFVILVLIWVPSRNLSVVISFLMVFPILYTNVLDGERQMDAGLLEMAKVFELSRPARIRYLYLPQILPYFRTGCSVALGLCWKAGVAAEVIGIPDNSIGEQLYQAKVYLNTPDLFAWTIVIVLLSVVFERLFLLLIDRGVRCLENDRIKKESTRRQARRTKKPEQTKEPEQAKKPEQAKESEQTKHENQEEHASQVKHTKQESVDQKAPAIHITDLTKTYGSHVVFENLSLTIPSGTTTCLMAPSGAGKTTLLRILMGLEPPDSGTITGLEGKKISTAFQEPRLCENLSAFANIRMVRKKKPQEKTIETWKEIHHAMETLGLGGHEHQPVHEMSGGMRQRVALLRALYAQWDILFLDEPFQGLDQETKEKTMTYLKDTCQGKTIILVTHSQEEAEKMGPIITL